MPGKRTRRDMRCVLFPENARRGTYETAKAVKSSWERCGDSFLDTPMMEKHKAVRRTNWVVQLQAQPSTSVRPNTGDEDPVHIAWTSSEDEQFDDEQPLRLLPTDVSTSKWRSRAVGASGGYNRFLSTGADELPTIDSDSEHEDISATSEPVSPVAVEIQDYSSHSEEDQEHRQPDPPADQRLRSFSEWARSAQALKTPPKQTEKPSKTPEDSGRKKRKFESGGFAERLNRLHCRQRSSISFWRHQPVSEERPGVLVLYVQTVWEVCGMQAALCQRQPMRETCIAFFSKETAAQLAPGTGDTIHVYPPWQSLTVDGERHPIILNTHFSQKVSEDRKQDSSGTCFKILKCLKKTTKPYALTRCLWKREENFTSSQASIYIRKTNGAVGSVYESLLEALDACGTKGFVCASVEVVVQRVYFYTIADFPSKSLLGHGAISRCLSGTTQRQHIRRCCLLVQDVYGMFSEVEMQHTYSEEDLKHFTENLQGKVCLLQGLKVIQRLTRERCAQLFSLIDSLWPPVVPLRVPAESSCHQTGKSAAPSFCYRLKGQQDCVLIKHESPLYHPAFVQNLQDILQDEPTRRLCSFKGVVVYKRQKDKEEDDLLLFVTDSSLQDEQSSEILSRILPVYVNSTLLLQTSVCQAIAEFSPQFRPMLVFRDVLMEQGKIIITRQSVIELDSENRNSPSLRSVLLDQLTPQSPSCSLCTLTGVVMDVDESSAFSWPACSHCGSDSLETLKDRQDFFSCVSCGVVDKPSKQMHLEVFLSCPSVCPWTVKVKLQQKSIMSLLNSTKLTTEVYEVEAVVGKSVGPLNAFIHVVTRSSTALWMALEEITL